jgi:hypothetical protein
LERALYGLIESAKLWYEEFSAYLKQLGFIPNPHDPCAFNKDFNRKQCTLVLYVDDCFVSYEDPAALDYVEQKITERYGGCTRHDGDVQPFLGERGVMMNFTEKEIVTFLHAFMDEIVRNAEVATIADTPAGNHLFYIEETSPKLSKEARETFHSDNAKLLYLAKRTRVDIPFSVSFLCTRVREPTEDDLRKLKRVLGGNGRSPT